MTAISLKLKDSLIDDLKFFASKNRLSQTKIIEQSLNQWIQKEKELELEESFACYKEKLEKNPNLKKEEKFLTSSSIKDFYNSNKKGNVY